MPDNKTRKEAILDAAEELFRSQGYGNTSMADIGQATGLLKGSVYHYFPGKEALAASIIERLRGRFSAGAFAIAFEEGVPDQRWRRMIDKIEEYFRESQGCLMGHLGLEMGGKAVQFGEPVRSFFNEWVAAFAHVLDEEYDRLRARTLAKSLICRIEGAVMWLQVYGDAEPLELICEEIRGLVPFSST